MTYTKQLLDRARTLCTPHTWYQLAQRLDIDPATISRCIHKHATLDNAAVIKLAKFLDQPFIDVLALVELDRAKSADKKAFWENYAPRLLPSLVIALIATAAGGQRQVSAAPRNQGDSTTYTLCEVRRWMRRFKTAIRRGIEPPRVHH